MTAGAAAAAGAAGVGVAVGIASWLLRNVVAQLSVVHVMVVGR